MSTHRIEPPEPHVGERWVTHYPHVQDRIVVHVTETIVMFRWPGDYTARQMTRKSWRMWARENGARVAA